MVAALCEWRRSSCAGRLSALLDVCSEAVRRREGLSRADALQLSTSRRFGLETTNLA